MNKLQLDTQKLIIHSLCEGGSIRGIERITGVHRDTIMRLGVRVGEACHTLQDEIMRDLECQTLELDEIWGYIRKKQRNVTKGESEDLGHVWTWVALDSDTKLVPAYHVGKRDLGAANIFMKDLSSRMLNRVQISTDGLKAYVEAVEQGFGADVDYAQIVKSYTIYESDPERKYSPPAVTSSEKYTVFGSPISDKISTSYVERQNLTMRMHCRRLARLTNAFSKKLKNFKAAIALHFAYYNLIKTHKTIRVTPAMAAGVTNRVWTVMDLVERIN